MVHDLEFEMSLLVTALADARDTVRSARLKDRSSLTIVECPAPYVPPRLRLVGSTCTSGLERDVILVRAPAAVGKSTTAAYLSFTNQIPILDLSTVPVATSSFTGLLDDAFEDSRAAVSAFHDGTLPIIIDALDEGRVLSGETAFESFLDTLGKYITDRSTVPSGTPKHPKVILFGRDESIDLTQIGVLWSAQDLNVGTVELLFFDQSSATDLINKSAIDSIHDPEQRNTIAERQLYAHPMRTLISKYFREIGTAIGLPKDRASDPDPLWSVPSARAFAGYAPVLVALGSILARTHNPYEITMSYDSDDAWGVLSGVLSEILEREGSKFRKAMGKAQVVECIPTSAYDSGEQLMYLTYVIHNDDVVFSARSDLGFSRIEDTHVYIERVRTALADHPFVKKSLPANDVMGAAIVAHAISEGLLSSESGHDKHIRRLSRQPFLWLHIRKLIMDEGNGGTEVLMEGRYLGYLFRSHWSDPQISSTSAVRIAGVSDSDPDMARVTVAQLTFDTVGPIVMYGSLNRGVIEGVDELVIQGEGESSVFEFSGNTRIVCNRVLFLCRSIKVRGKLFIDSVPGQGSEFSVIMSEGTEITLREELRRCSGWSRIATQPTPATEGLLGFVEEFQHRLSGSNTIVLTENYEIDEDNMKLKWVARNRRMCCSRLVRSMVTNDLATTEPFGTANASSFRIRFHFDWQQLKSAMRGGRITDDRIRRLLGDARRSDNFGFG